MALLLVLFDIVPISSESVDESPVAASNVVGSESSGSEDDSAAESVEENVPVSPVGKRAALHALEVEDLQMEATSLLRQSGGVRRKNLKELPDGVHGEGDVRVEEQGEPTRESRRRPTRRVPDPKATCEEAVHRCLPARQAALKVVSSSPSSLILLFSVGQ